MNTAMFKTLPLVQALVVLISLAKPVGTGTAAAQTVAPSSKSFVHDPRFSKIRDIVLERVNRDIPSFGISVVHDGKILWEESFGFADQAAKIAATPSTAYPIASVAKSITATGVMQLAEKSELDIDDALSDYLGPDIVTPLAGPSEDCHVRDLLTMTAGIPMGFLGVNEPHPVPDRDEIYRQHGGLIVFPPNKVFHYSNFSLGLAELVIEKVTGQSFSKSMRTILFDPAGMNNTYYSGSAPANVQVARTYDESGAAYPSHTAMPAGGGGAYSSVSDLRRYALAHLGHAPEPNEKSTSPILSAKLRKTMHSTIAVHSDGMFALGWWVVDLGDGGKLLVSDGHGMGAMALVQLFPKQDIAVVCVMNIRKDDADGKPLTNKIASQVMEILSPGFNEKFDRFWQQQSKADETKNIYHPTPELLGHWAGYVRAFDGGKTNIEMQLRPNGEILVTLEDQYTVVLWEPHYRNQVLEGYFVGKLPVSVPCDHYNDIETKILFDGEDAYGYVNLSVADERGEYSLPSYIHLKHDVADQEKE
jgi:CubicO group peptidase (beta-lactamase class C family)